MGGPGGLEIVGSRGFFRLRGTFSLDAAVELVVAAITAARAHGLTDLLVDVAELTGFDPPSVTQRFLFVERMAFAAGSEVRMAMVAPAELIDPGRFGVTVALNRGFVSNIFASEDLAIAWLDGLNSTQGEP
jgi:hypothetical protein